MRYMLLFLTGALLCSTIPASGQDIPRLAECTVKVFREINLTQKWSGKPPAGCPEKIVVEKRSSGVFVTAWSVDRAEGGWVRTAFAAAMNYAEIAGKTPLAKAGKDVMARAVRLERCLNSINTVNDPLDCRDRAVKSYIAGEITGTETKRLVWLDDNGRHTVVEFAFGTSSATPTPPVDLFNGENVLPGMIIDLHLTR
jgi:hypothetical protein